MCVSVTVHFTSSPQPELDTLPPNDPGIRSQRGSSASGSQPTIEQQRGIQGLQGLNVLQAYERQRRAQQSGTGADKNSRITLTPFASTENIGSRDSVTSTHSASYGIFKRKPRRGRTRGGKV